MECPSALSKTSPIIPFIERLTPAPKWVFPTGTAISTSASKTSEATPMDLMRRPLSTLTSLNSRCSLTTLDAGVGNA